MKQKQMNFVEGVLNKISLSAKASEKEKLHLLNFVGYLTQSEQRELMQAL